MSASWIGLGIISFNASHYQDAAERFQAAASELHRFDTAMLTDEDYRDLTECYINLADSLLHIHQPDNAINARQNAFFAFHQIVEKTSQEMAILSASNVPQAFIAFYEEKLSTKQYLESNEYSQNWQVLETVCEQREIENCLQKLNMNVSYPVMIQNASLGEKSFLPIVPVDQATDGDRRVSAEEFCSLGEKYAENDEYGFAIQAFQTATKALEMVNDKTERDWALMEEIGKQVKILGNNCDESRISHGEQMTMGNHGLFASQYVPESRFPLGEKYSSFSPR